MQASRPSGRIAGPQRAAPCILPIVDAQARRRRQAPAMSPATDAHADGPLPAEWAIATADALETPLLLIDGAGGLIHANAAARRWLDAASSPLRLDADRRLQVRREADARGWHGALARASAIAAASATAGGPAPEALPGWRLLPLPLPAQPGLEAPSPVAALLLRPAREGE